MESDHKQIGEVAERLGLSLRTIRYYEEVGLVTPSARSRGGFRLYSEADIARLEVVMGMKPLDFSLEEMRDLMEVLERLDAPDVEPQERASLVDTLTTYQEAADTRCASLRRKLGSAEDLAARLRRRVSESAGPVGAATS